MALSAFNSSLRAGVDLNLRLVPPISLLSLLHGASAPSVASATETLRLLLLSSSFLSTFRFVTLRGRQAMSSCSLSDEDQNVLDL